MHRLIVDQLFQQRGGAVPVDPLQLQKADIEPGGEQPAQIGIQRRQQLVGPAHLQQRAAQIDQELPPIRDRRELRQQLQPRRFQRPAQRRLGGRPFRRVGGRLHLGIGVGDGIGVRIERRPGCAETPSGRPRPASGRSAPAWPPGCGR